VKGVLADHEAYQQSMMADHELQKQYREATLRRMAEGYRGDATGIGQLQAIPAVVDEDEDDDDDAELDNFMDQVSEQ
jgi:hypothetical protein